MKRKLFFATGFVLITFAFSSCESLSSCKICQENAYDSKGTLITAGNESEYCNAELIKIEAIPDATVLGVTSKWECR
jgi:hypothetical protein